MNPLSKWSRCYSFQNNKFNILSFLYYITKIIILKHLSNLNNLNHSTKVIATITRCTYTITPNMLTRKTLHQRENPNEMELTRWCTNINVPCERLDLVRSYIQYIWVPIRRLWIPIRICANFFRSCRRQLNPLSKQLQGQINEPTIQMILVLFLYI